MSIRNLELPDWSKDTMVVAGVTVESMAPIRRITVTMAEFTAMVRQQYGVVTPAILQKVRFLPDGRVDIPAIRR